MMAASQYTAPRSSQDKVVDATSAALIFEGASLSQLAIIFSMDIRKVKQRLHGCSPVRTRAGSPIYAIKDAAQYLSTPIYPLDEWIKKMKTSDLPAELSKDFWAAMRSRQDYELKQGNLWETETVKDHISLMLKTIAMSLRLIPDTIDRQVGMTRDQRNLIVALVDDALRNLHNVLEEKMLEQDRENGRSRIPDQG